MTQETASKAAERTCSTPAPIRDMRIKGSPRELGCDIVCGAKRPATGIRDGGGFSEGWETSTIGRVDNWPRQSERLTMAIAPTVRLGSFDSLPLAGTCRGDRERDGLGACQRTCASGRWAPLELNVSRAEVDNAEPHCARIALDMPSQPAVSVGGLSVRTSRSTSQPNGVSATP